MILKGPHPGVFVIFEGFIFLFLCTGIGGTKFLVFLVSFIGISME